MTKRIDLGHDGMHQLTVELKPYGYTDEAWYFCRDGEKMRLVDVEYLEGKLIKKILELSK